MHSESFPKKKSAPDLASTKLLHRELLHGALLGNLSIEMCAGGMEGTQRDAEVGSR